MEKKQFKIRLGTAIMLFLLLIILLATFAINIIKTNSDKNKEIVKEQVELEKTTDITIVPTMQDEITADSSWCGTFQLVWNDMKHEVVKKDIIFNPQIKMAENLNKEEFTEDMISEEYYFKKYGLKTLALKEEIENGIKEKFNQESDILDQFDWSEEALNDSNNRDGQRYFFYVMLYRKFEFLQEFDKLENQKFADYDNIEYFGIDKHTDNSVGDQIDVLYYNSQDDFAIILNTKQNDEVILYKNPEGKTFDEIYKNMNNKAKNYKGKKYLEDIDELKVPNLKFNKFMSYEELKNKKFLTADGKQAEIIEAMQTIQFELDKKGGKIKSEAVVVMGETALLREDEPRYFYLDDTFAIFLREQGKDMPYFAARIDDISKFQ